MAAGEDRPVDAPEQPGQDEQTVPVGEPEAPVAPPAPSPGEQEGGSDGQAGPERDDGAAGDGGQPEAEQVEHDLDDLIARARERDEYLSLAQRTQADFENYRKRMAKDLAVAEARGVGRLAKELLPALDNLSRALAAARPRDEESPEHHLAEGIRLVHAELVAALGRVGIESFSPEGQQFDPAEHEAMAKQAVEGADAGTVVEVYQQGYRLNGNVLRPARVVVAE